MKYLDFKNYFQNYPVISNTDIINKCNSQTAYNQLNNWTKKGFIIQLKKGLMSLKK